MPQQMAWGGSVCNYCCKICLSLTLYKEGFFPWRFEVVGTSNADLGFSEEHGGGNVCFMLWFKPTSLSFLIIRMI